MIDSQTKAEFALNTELQTKVTDIPLVFPNMPYTPSVTGEFIRVSHIPGQKRQATLGSTGRNRISGVLTLYVSYPVSNENIGTYKVNDTAGRLISYFSRGTKLTYDGVVVTCERAQRTGSFGDESRYTAMVEISWYAYTAKDTATS